MDLEFAEPTDDTGAKTLGAFRYQAGIAALFGLGFFKDKLEYDCIYCEHHEDILVKLKSGKFLAIQVKTKNPDGDAFKATDRKILGAIKAFVRLEEKYGDQIVNYILISNHGFSTKKNIYGLTYMQKLAGAQVGDETHEDLLKYFKRLRSKTGVKKGDQPSTPKEAKPRKVKRSDLNPSPSSPLRARADNDDYAGDVDDDEEETGEEDPKFQIDLSQKTDQLLTKTLAKLKIKGAMERDIEGFLAEMITKIDSFGTILISQARVIAANLTTHFLNSSTSHPGTDRFLILEAVHDGEVEKLARIAAKTVKKESVQQIISDGVMTKLLVGPAVKVENLSSGTQRMNRKADRGGIHGNNLDLASMYKSNTEYFIKELNLRIGKEEAEKLISHIELIIWTQCQISYDNHKNLPVPFGENQLNDIRERLQNVYDEHFSHVPGIYYEHLLGFAWLLTEECKLWWSPEFNLGDA